MAPDGKRLNRIVLLVFAPVLILTGVLGFVLPTDKSLTSGATPYNIFHIVFGTLGLLLALSKNEKSIRFFNVGFGLLDLYQAAASFAHLFPVQFFRWTTADDVLHIVIGAALIFIGLYGRKAASRLRR
ncbi:MAG: DUF4383 domain-containing protein [Acidobacteria bacterium]|nr:DUF4383 domain-containing protein [Acidobacteriota bacterium]